MKKFDVVEGEFYVSQKEMRGWEWCSGRLNVCVCVCVCVQVKQSWDRYVVSPVLNTYSQLGSPRGPGKISRSGPGSGKLHPEERAT